MQYRTFESLVNLLQEQQRRSDAAVKIGIDLIEFTEPVFRIIDLMIKEIYGEKGFEWFSWFCYDSDYGRRDWSNINSFLSDEEGNLMLEKQPSDSRYGAFDDDGNPICHSIESTWEFLEKNFSKAPEVKEIKKKTKAKQNKEENPISAVLKIINKQSY